MINRWEPGRADTTRAHPIAAELGVWFGGLDPVFAFDRVVDTDDHLASVLGFGAALTQRTS